MGKTFFEQIPLEEALKSVAREKMSAKKKKALFISSIRETLDRSQRLVQQAKERIADSKALRGTYDELLKRRSTTRS